MKLVLATFSALGFLLSTTSHAAPALLKFECRDPKLGHVEIALKDPRRISLGCDGYNIDLKRMDLDMNPYEERQHVQSTSPDPDDFHARICDDDSYTSMRLPPTKVDWSLHSNECWVDSKFVGAWLKLDIASGKAVSEIYGTLYSLQELNPATEIKMDCSGSGWGPFCSFVPFLGDKKCKSGPDSIRPMEEPVCKRIQ